MAWLAVNKCGEEIISPEKPERDDREWYCDEEVWIYGERYYVDKTIIVPNGTIHKLTGLHLSWSDEPVKII